MGLALSQAGEKRNAEQEFARAIELDPDLYEAHYYWARLCFEQGNLSAAAGQPAQLHEDVERRCHLLANREYRKIQAGHTHHILHRVTFG